MCPWQVAVKYSLMTATYIQNLLFSLLPPDTEWKYIYQNSNKKQTVTFKILTEKQIISGCLLRCTRMKTPSREREVFRIVTVGILHLTCEGRLELHENWNHGRKLKKRAM